MASIDVTGLLRLGLLDGVGMLVAARSADAQSLGDTVAEACTKLGASVGRCEAHADDEAAMDRAAGALDLHSLVVDGASMFVAGMTVDGRHEAGPGGGHAGLRACLDGSWNITRAVINHAFLAHERGGRVVYLAPPPDAGALAEAARAGLENLARTLSIEWARHGVNVLCIAPGTETMADEVAALCAYLASPAGAYFSGCLLDLRGPS